VICLTVLYPNEPGGWFDFDYYVHKHIPFDISLLPPLAGAPPNGAPRTETLRGAAGPDGSAPPFLCLGRIWLNNVEEFLLFARNEAAGADLKNYTNVAPMVFFGEAYP